VGNTWKLPIPNRLLLSGSPSRLALLARQWVCDAQSLLGSWTLHWQAAPWFRTQRDIGPEARAAEYSNGNLIGEDATMQRSSPARWNGQRSLPSVADTVREHYIWGIAHWHPSLPGRFGNWRWRSQTPSSCERSRPEHVPAHPWGYALPKLRENRDNIGRIE